MHTDELPEDAPGEYSSYGQRSAYSPNKLPPNRTIEIDEELSELLRDAVYHLGRLDGLTEESDGSPLLYTTLVRREAVESVLIEGGDLGLEDVFRSDSVGFGDKVEKDVQEAVNYEAVVQRGVDAVSDDGVITLALLKKLHADLLDGVRDNSDHPGEFRKDPVHIPSPNRTQKPFVLPAPGKIQTLMENLQHYLVTESGYHDLIDIGIVHYQFETIHPFGDGNGRLGRVLITLQLVRDGYLSEPYLYPSAYFNKHKVEYAQRMRAVSERGEWEEWLRFFLNGIKQQAAEAVERTGDLRTLRRRYESQYGHGRTAADRLAVKLFESPYLRTADVRELLDVTGQTARNAISELVAEGVLEEVTGKQRYKEYKATEIFDVLDKPLD